LEKSPDIMVKVGSWTSAVRSSKKETKRENPQGHWGGHTKNVAKKVMTTGQRTKRGVRIDVRASKKLETEEGQEKNGSWEGGGVSFLSQAKWKEGGDQSLRDLWGSQIALSHQTDIRRERWYLEKRGYRNGSGDSKEPKE